MTEAQHFYLERDQRICLYLHGKEINQIPICVLLDQAAAASAPGQACLLALANQLSRVHRNICFVLPPEPSPLIVPALFAATTLADTVLATARNIDPYGSFAVAPAPPSGNALSIGLGQSLPSNLTWYMGAAGAIAYLDHRPCLLDTSMPTTTLGAVLASCLGTAALLRSALELPTTPRTLSCWNYSEGDAAHPGPQAIPRLDLGRTLVVGIGAVGSALIYWLHLFGVVGTWDLVDPDRVKVHNTSRQLLYIPQHAGWPNRSPALKAEIAAPLLPNSQPYPQWYDECQAIKNVKYDVILALANEKEVRTRLAKRNPAVLLHATTGENWLSQVHRHILGQDDCIVCRMNDVKEARFGCSASALPAGVEASVPDAALPFLSAASGLMLATALQKLQLGELHLPIQNDWRWSFDSAYKMATSGRRACRDECQIVPPPQLRQRLNANTRWAALIH